VLRELPQGAGIAASVTQLCVAQFADFCSVYLRSTGPVPVALAGREGVDLGTLRALSRDDAFVDTARTAGLATILEEPLVASGRVVGTFVVGLAPLRRFSAANRRAVAHFASILSIAIDQAEQLALHYHVSKRLQRALLPSRLASVDGATFDAAYLPATAGTDVGGDWYDTFDAGNGLVGISAGDVVGHGIEAAVAMSEIRGAIRATAATTHSPSAVLRIVDELMCARSMGMATAIAGFYDPATGVLRYASAGHPPPVLRWPSGRAIPLPGGGLILGLGGGNASNDVTVTIPRGATLLLYTDGLLEYGRDVIQGERTLLNAVSRLAPGAGYAERLHAALFEDGVENADDCATLALHRSGDAAKRELLVYSSIGACAGLAREAVGHFSSAFIPEGDRRYEIVSAVGEAVANAIEHGESQNGSVFHIHAAVRSDDLVLEVRNPGHWRSFTPSIDRGRGLHIMRTYAQKLEISSAQDETRVKLTFARRSA
jgi:anti-sigma regulatory factor (Ser/Thr protein kinase)